MIHIFIINHFAGSKNLAKDLRSHLANRNDIRYFVFNTIQEGFERDIVRKIRKYFENEKLRFYCCGGSGTMRNMLNGFDDLTDIEVAFFPCGLANDFLKCFDDHEAFRDIDKLIDGKVVELDYIKTNYGVALNTISVGFDSNVARCMSRLRPYDIINSQVPYFMSVVEGIMFAKPRLMEITLDGEKYSKKYAEIVFGNGCVLGGNLFFTERNSVTDGVASFMVATNITGLEALFAIIKIMKKKIRNLSNKVRCGTGRKIEIRSLDDQPIYINYDGELVECGKQCCAEIVQKGLKFVIPQEVEVKEFSLY